MSVALRISIGANLILAGALAVLLWRDRPVVPAVIPAVARPVAAPAAPPIAEIQSNPAGSGVTPSVVAELDRAGISRDVVVSILLEDINRRTARRVLDLQKRYAPRQVPDHEMRALSRQDDIERIRTLKAALGEDGYLAWDKTETLRNLNRARAPGDELPMTPAEAEQAYRLQKEFDENSQQLQMMMEDGTADRADVGALQAQAQQVLDKDLEKLLGKQRFDELRGNTDPATEVSRRYADLNPTPGQAEAVRQIEADHRAREAALVAQLNQNPADAARITAELKAMGDAQEDSLRRIFGPEAYDSAKRENDPTYQTLQQYAAAWELSAQDVQSVYQAVRGFQDQADQLRRAAEMREAAGQRVNWREFDAALAQQQQQAEASLQGLIGDERLRRLKRNGVLTIR